MRRKTTALRKSSTPVTALLVFLPVLLAAASDTPSTSTAGAIRNAAQEGLKPLTILRDKLLEIGASFIALLPNIISALILLLLTWLVVTFVRRLLTRVFQRSHIRPSLIEVIRRLVGIAIWIGGLLGALVIVFPSISLGKVVAALGFGSIAIGFAFKDIFENFFAGILILWRMPFEEGDFIECEDLRGFVEKVQLRNTYLRMVDGQLLVVPNADLFKNPVNVVTSRRQRRYTIVCGVAYGEDADESRRVIQDAVENCETVDADRPVQVFAKQFGSSSIDFEIAWWSGSTPLDERQSRDKVVAAVKRALDDAGIEIPFPYRTLTFKEPLALHSTDGDGSGGDSSKNLRDPTNVQTSKSGSSPTAK